MSPNNCLSKEGGKALPEGLYYQALVRMDDIHTLTHIHTRTRTHMHTHAHAHAHMHTHAHAHMHTHAHAHAHTHTHTHQPTNCWGDSSTGKGSF